ncbi:MAG: acyl carrier protein [Candidatus Amulumruptor caecigallinarius]|nr:acyl carrier protein [Candidatus Amulumruptor caecigallinarius]MCM1397619.1 acyl carrier protein [Candidatus Amulumruptor caecigallinarius]MCM1454598.1 acyl carrier protein [bacterium]
MDINEFIEKFAEVFDDTDASVITPETRFRDLDEWSSLTGLGTIAFADEEFGVELGAQELRGVNTVQELYDLLSSK